MIFETLIQPLQVFAQQQVSKAVGMQNFGLLSELTRQIAPPAKYQAMHHHPENREQFSISSQTVWEFCQAATTDRFDL